MKKITIGIIAHVDSGKTTLSEALLYRTGSIRSFGRVDKGSSFLDHDSVERKRGITIYSKQARFSFQNTAFVLIDTPGHTDFSAETERTLQVLDYAILLLSASDGIKGQTQLLWDLLARYRIPVFLFVNKMDQPQADKASLLAAIDRLSGGTAVDFSSYVEQTKEVGLPLSFSFDTVFYEQAALCSEAAMEEVLSTGSLRWESLCRLIADRQLFPCIFGSALHLKGIDPLLAALDCFTKEPLYHAEFSAQVYKIGREEDGTRLTFLKVTGGSLKPRTLLPDGSGETKIQQIRFYSGAKFRTTEEAVAGDICAVTGLKHSAAGQGFGKQSPLPEPYLTPVLSYRVLSKPEMDAVRLLPLLKQMEEESPELSLAWEEDKQELTVFVMGSVQLEVLKTVIMNRFGISLSFDLGEVVYKETIAAPVIGVGHFEPLRHYAEVHLLMEPLPSGSGLQFASAISTDRLAKNWQRLIMTHLGERRHRGVLTGSPITDIKFTLTAGKAHLKHTEGGDFRQAVYRAVRQGLMMAENVLLEPFYRFTLEVPFGNIGKALGDLERMQAAFSSPELQPEKGTGQISGRGPVAALKDYPGELKAFTKGLGSIRFVPDGYGPCHNAEEVLLRKNYDPLRDPEHTPDSVFCSGGSGYTVPYDEVYDVMHLAFDGTDHTAEELPAKAISRTMSEVSLGTDEVNAIISRISGANKKEKGRGNVRKKNFGTSSAASSPLMPAPTAGVIPFSVEESEIFLVDGYNVIFTWEDLSTLAKINIDAARDSLIETLSKFRSMIDAEVIVVFDAYRVAGHIRKKEAFLNIRVVYTKEEETADQYIERYTNEYRNKKKITVVTSDGMEQIITRGQGCRLLSSRELKNRIEERSRQLNETYHIKQKDE